MRSNRSSTKAFGTKLTALAVVASLLAQAACGGGGIDAGGDDPVSTETSQIVDEKKTMPGGSLYSMTSCQPQDVRTVHRWNGSHATTDIQSLIADMITNNPLGFKATNLDAAFYAPLGDKRTFVVHHFPDQLVNIHHDIASSSFKSDTVGWTGKEYLFNDPAFDSADYKPPSNLAPMMVIAAREIVVPEGAFGSHRRVMLLAEKLTVQGETTFGGQGKLNVVAREIVFKKPGTKLLVPEGSVVLSGKPLPKGAVVAYTWTANNGDDPGFLMKYPLKAASTISDVTWGRLVRHYAPFFLRRTFHLGETRMRTRQGYAKWAYQSAKAIGGLEETISKAAEVRLQQLAKGFNYLGESDNLFAQDDWKTTLDSAKWAYQQINFLKLEDLATTIGAEQMGFVETEASETTKLVKKERELVVMNLEAAKKFLEKAKVKFEADQKQLQKMLDDKTENQKKLESAASAVEAACVKAAEPPPWYEVLWDALSFVADIVGAVMGIVSNIEKIVNSVKSLIDKVTKLIDDMKAMFDTLKKFWETTKEMKAVVDGIGTIVDSGKKVYEKIVGEIEKFKAAKGYDSLQQLWDLAPKCDASDKLNGLATPKEMKALDGAIVDTTGSIKVSGLELEHAKILFEAGQLEVMIKDAEIEMNEKLVEEAKAAKKTIEGAAKYPLEAGVESMNEQICRMGQRIADKVARLAYKATKGCAFKALSYKNKTNYATEPFCWPGNFVLGQGFVAGKCFWPNVPNVTTFSGVDATSPHNFTFGYNYYDTSFTKLGDFIGLGGGKGLDETCADVEKTFAKNGKYFEKVTLSADALASFKKSGVFSVKIPKTAGKISSGEGPIRVAGIDVFMGAKSVGTYIKARKPGFNVYRLADGAQKLVVPMGNIVFPAGEEMSFQTKATAPVNPGTNWSVDEKTFEPLFGLSWEGDWEIRLDPTVAANASPGAKLRGVTNVTIGFYLFKQ